MTCRDMQQVVKGVHVWVVVVVAVTVCSAPLRADDPPTLDYFFPAGARQGTTVAVTVGGQFSVWPVQFWTDGKGLKFTAEQEQRKVSVEVAGDAPPGMHWVRIMTPYGASPPRPFVVGHRDEIGETEPNNEVAQPQPIEQLPVTINGRLLESGDVDSFAITLEAGQWLIGGVEAFSIGYGIDPVLDLRDPQGVKLANNHDDRNFDSLLAYQAERAGVHILQVMAFGIQRGAWQSLSMTGGEAAVYRLTLSHGPHARYTYPAGIAKGVRTPLYIYGWNLPGGSDALVQQVELSDWQGGRETLLHVDEVENLVAIDVTTDPAAAEIEPNDEHGLAQPVVMPVMLDGRIGRPGDVDTFSFSAAKDEQFEFRLTSWQRGYPLTPVLRIIDSEGKELVRNEHTHSNPQLRFTAPADGKFLFEVTGLTQDGGREHVYRIRCDAGPRLELTADEHTYLLPPGNTQLIKLGIIRLNFKHRLNLVVDGLPPGVTATAPQTSEGADSVEIELTAAAGATPANGPIAIYAIASTGGEPVMVKAQAPIKGPADMVLGRTEAIWLTIPPRVRPEPVQVAKRPKD